MYNQGALAQADLSNVEQKAIAMNIAAMKPGDTAGARDLHGEVIWQNLGEDRAKQDRGKIFNKLVKGGLFPSIVYLCKQEGHAIYLKN